MEFIVPEPFEVTHRTPGPKIGRSPAGQAMYGPTVVRQRFVRGFEPAGEREVRTAQLAGRKITELMMMDGEGDWPSDSTVEFQGRTFEVNGDVRDENLGPYGFKPGYVIPLRRVTNGPS